jgi:hypothetical protein
MENTQQIIALLQGIDMELKIVISMLVGWVVITIIKP